jgi:D-amino-acid oxidase
MRTKSKAIFLLCITLLSQPLMADNKELEIITAPQSTLATSILENLEIHKITPPKLGSINLGKKILCHRPMRKGTPAMNIEVIDGKIIANNYGHGGSGWTLAPGAAKYIINLLQKQPATSLNQHTPVAIVGAGVLGLFSALELVNQGYKDITIIAKTFDNLTSHNAGGLLAPASMHNTPELQKTIDDIGIESYKFYKNISLKKNKQIKTGAVIIPAYFTNRQISGLEPYVGKVMEPAKDVIVDFKNGTTHQMVVYKQSIFINTEGLMSSLTETLKKAGVKFVQQNITSFKEITQEVIFNCSGLGAKELASDDKMVSVQGHLIMLKEQQPKDINYMMLVYFGQDKTKTLQDITRAFYIFPKQAFNAGANDIGVIGGTFIENADESTANTEEFDILIKNAQLFYGIAE